MTGNKTSINIRRHIVFIPPPSLYHILYYYITLKEVNKNAIIIREKGHAGRKEIP